jgi:predicted esterase
VRRGGTHEAGGVFISPLRTECKPMTHVVCCCCRYIESLIEAEVASGVPSERVVVAGFSQGGAVAMLMLRSKHKLAGIVGESSCTCTAPATDTAEQAQAHHRLRGLIFAGSSQHPLIFRRIC